MKLIHAIFCVVFALCLATALSAKPFTTSCVNVNLSTEKEFGEYYYITGTENTRELYVTMTTAVDGLDIDLYLRAGKEPNRDEYDEADLSISKNVEIYHRTEGETKDVKYYVGVYAFSGKGTVEICAHLHDCINRDCGSKSDNPAGTCTPETGVCKCNEGFDGKGCELKIVNAEFGTQYNNKLPQYSTIGYRFDVDENNPGSYMHFYLSRTVLDSWLTLRARLGSPPTVDDYDFDAHLTPSTTFGELHVNRRNFASGVWYVTVSTESVNFGVQQAQFDFVAHLYTCPSNCSGNGVCKTETGTCECEKDYKAASDCSLYSVMLAPGADVDLSIKPNSNIGFYFEVSEAISLRNVDLVVHFESKTSTDLGRYPKLYIGHGDPTAGRRTNYNRYIATSPEPTEQLQSVHIPDHDTNPGKYQGILYNDYGTEIQGSLKITLTAHCPNDCSGNGECLSSGVCECKKDFYSTDCSVTKDTCVAKFNTKDSGISTAATVIAIIVVMIVAAVVGPFAFKFFNERKRAAEGRAPRVAASDADVSVDNQYSELN